MRQRTPTSRPDQTKPITNQRRPPDCAPLYQPGRPIMETISAKPTLFPDLASASRRRWRSDMAVAVLVLTPSMLAVAIFIYSFIVWSFYISGTKWNSAVVDLSWVGLDNWARLLSDDRFRTDIRNLLLYAAGFMSQCIILGFVLAVLIDQK